MASNIKPKSSGREAPTEPFKRAVASCLRAIAKKPELEIGYAAERPALASGKVRLPEPPRKLGAQEAAIIRGHADAFALRLACHDPAVHRRLAPGGQQARAVFDAVEQARVEAIGARRMEGVASNLGAMLDDRFHRGKFDDVTDRADAPIEDAIALMVRERLTGQLPPPAARKLVDFMLSARFQADVPLQMFVFPVREGTPLPPVFTKFAEVPTTPLSLPPADIGAHRDEWIEQWTDTVLQ